MQVIDPVAKTPKRALEAYRSSREEEKRREEEKEVQVVKDGSDDEEVVIVQTSGAGREKGGKRCYGEWNLCSAKETQRNGGVGAHKRRKKSKGAADSGAGVHFWVEVHLSSVAGKASAWESLDPTSGLAGTNGKYEKGKGLCVAFRGGR